MTEREEAIEQIYAAISAPCSVEQYRAAAKDWVVVPIRSGWEIVGGVLIRHNELHVAVTRTPTASARALIRGILGRTIMLYGSAVTTVYPRNTAGLRFCLRLGFEVTWQDEEIIQMRCTRCRHA